MQEKELIAKIKGLKQIKPRHNWAVLAKARILGQEPEEETEVSRFFKGVHLILRHKFAFTSLVVLFALTGTFGFTQNSLPGDFFYPVKKATENAQTALTPTKDQPKRNVEIANKRLDELTRVAQANASRNLEPAITEVQASILKVAESLKELGAEKTKEIVKDVKEIETKTIRIRSLGVEISDTEELNSALIQKITDQVAELAKKDLSPEQIAILEEIKKLIEGGDYAGALEKILEINGN